MPESEKIGLQYKSILRKNSASKDELNDDSFINLWKSVSQYIKVELKNCKKAEKLD